MPLIRSALAIDTRRYWSAARLACRVQERWGRVDNFVIDDLRRLLDERPSERLACATVGTLASLGHGYSLDGRGIV